MNTRLMGTWKLVEHVFNYLLRLARRRNLHTPLEGVQLQIGTNEQFPAKRNFAFCCVLRPGSPPTIVIAPKFRQQPVERQVALLAHELGHAWYMAQETEHTELQADAFGEQLLGCLIFYDMDLVQNTCSGVRPRPSHLPV